MELLGVELPKNTALAHYEGSPFLRVTSSNVSFVLGLGLLGGEIVGSFSNGLGNGGKIIDIDISKLNKDILEQLIITKQSIGLHTNLNT